MTGVATIYDLKPKFQAMLRPQAALAERKSARLGLGRLAQNGMPISASTSMKQAQARSVVIARTWFHRIQARRKRCH